MTIGKKRKSIRDLRIKFQVSMYRYMRTQPHTRWQGDHNNKKSIPNERMMDTRPPVDRSLQVFEMIDDRIGHEANQSHSTGGWEVLQTIDLLPTSRVMAIIGRRWIIRMTWWLRIGLIMRGLGDIWRLSRRWGCLGRFNGFTDCFRELSDPRTLRLTMYWGGGWRGIGRLMCGNGRLILTMRWCWRRRFQLIDRDRTGLRWFLSSIAFRLWRWWMWRRGRRWRVTSRGSPLERSIRLIHSFLFRQSLLEFFDHLP